MFELGVLDLNMPGIDGIELAKGLKEDPETSKMTLFLLSSSGQKLGAAESHLRGFAGSLTKPVRQSELFDCLLGGLNEGTQLISPVTTSPASAKPPERKGRILLVEDKPINQLVGSKVLDKLGYDVTVANHGGEAVGAVLAGPYDAILMDCQMPVMDGNEATTEIRRIEGSERRTPIIAVTAAAMDGEGDRCLAAGMDDYITKPVRFEAVAAALARWIVPNALHDGTGDQAAGLADDGCPSPLDHSQIALLRSLDDGIGSLLGAVIDEYLTQAVDGRDELLRVVVEGDIRGVEFAAHVFGGASASVGAAALAAVCAEIEGLARMTSLDGAAGLMERFDIEFALAKDALGLITPRS